MRLISGVCAVCGQALLRQGRRLRKDQKRWVCSEGCRSDLYAADAGVAIATERRLCLRCGDAFLSTGRHVGVAHRRGGADICPACWQEGLEAPEPDGPYLDSVATLIAALGRSLRAAVGLLWRRGSRCPRCGDVYRAPYEWECRYPLAAGLCEGLEGPHVHSVCYRCGYETVKLKMKTPPAGVPTRGAALTVEQ